MADFIFNKFKEYMADGTIDMDGDTFKVALFTDSALPAAADYATYTALAAAKTEVANGNGYATGGTALVTPTWVEAAGVCTFDAADPAWAAATFTARYAAIYSDTSANKALVCLIDFGEDKSVSNNTFTIQLNASGIFTST